MKLSITIFLLFKFISAEESVLVFGGYGGSTGEILSSTEQILESGKACLTDLPEIPGGYYGQVATIRNNKAMLCGGWNDFGVTNECFMLDLTEPTPSWKSMPKMNDRRVYATSLVLNGTMVVLGGYSDQFGQNLDTVEFWDPTDEIWKYDRSMKLPMKLSRHCLVEHNETLFIIGGEGSDKVFSYQNQGWREVNSFPLGPINSQACISLPNEILLTGGKTLQQNELLQTWTLNLETQTWIESGSLWNPRRSHGMVNLNGIPTVFGGYDFIPFKTRKETAMIEQRYGSQWEDSNYSLNTPRLMFAYAKLKSDRNFC